MGFKPIDDPKRVVIVDGIRFVKEKRKSGYWYPSEWHRRKGGKHPALHIYMWEKANGRKVPKGYDIHHKDFNKDNNDPSNLVALTPSEHHAIHAAALTDKQKESFRRNLIDKAIPAARAWHKTAEGRAWHRKHAIKQGFGSVACVEKVCKHCGKTFVGNQNSVFCSNAHKSAWRRKMKLDDIEKTCEVCGKIFRSSRYENVKTCSRECWLKICGRPSRR